MFKKKQKGTGGFTFILVSFIMITAMITLIEVSAMDLARNISNDCAYQVAYHASVNLYNQNASSGTYHSTKNNDGTNYNLKYEFNKMLDEVYGDWIFKYPSSVVASWDRTNNKLTLTCSKLQSVWGDKITPEQQFIVIENHE